MPPFLIALDIGRKFLSKVCETLEHVAQVHAPSLGLFRARLDEQSGLVSSVPGHSSKDKALPLSIQGS